MSTIGLASKYIPLLDEVYKAGAKTAFLDAPAEMVREGLTANSVYIPNILMDGLADYSKTSGFVAGDVTFAWKQHTFSQDRGRRFIIDAIENMETIDMAFGSLAGQFIRTKVVPEVDAYRFAKIATNAVAQSNGATGTLSATTVVQAIDTALTALSVDEVEAEGLILYVSGSTYNFMKSNNVLTRTQLTNVGNMTGIDRNIPTLDGMPVIQVPQGRFYSIIDMLDGTSVGETGGGFAKNSSGKDINFLLVDPKAVIGITKTALPRIFDPETFQDANAWAFDYRLYHDLFVQEAKKNGAYVHTVA